MHLNGRFKKTKKQNVQLLENETASQTIIWLQLKAVEPGDALKSSPASEGQERGRPQQLLVRVSAAAAAAASAAALTKEDNAYQRL